VDAFDRQVARLDPSKVPAAGAPEAQMLSDGSHFKKACNAVEVPHVLKVFILADVGRAQAIFDFGFGCGKR